MFTALEACLVCLSTDVQMVSVNVGKIKDHYSMISGLKIQQGKGFPEFLCIGCLSYIKKYIKFREKCQRAHYTLTQILEKNKEITKPLLKAIDRKRLKIIPPLSYPNLRGSNVHYESVQFKWIKAVRFPPQSNDIPVMHYNTFQTNDTMMLKQNDLSDAHENGTFADEIPDSIFDDCFDTSNDADGSKLDEEYANTVPLSKNEAMAAVEIYKMLGHGSYQCQVCCKKYAAEEQLTTHVRMHDPDLSGNFYCDLCQCFYKTEFLLTSHVETKHMYKYLCTKCQEVSFDKATAKKHYLVAHIEKQTGPTTKEAKCSKKRNLLRVKNKKRLKLPKDFLVRTPITQEEQYDLIRQRKLSKNYKKSMFKCDYCYRGFREVATYKKHMTKHDPEVSGSYQCDMCKIYVTSTRQMYKHMSLAHLNKYSCRICNFVCFCRGQAKMHYRWHKNVTYPCPHCDQNFTKLSTRLTHIRIKHPSTNICNVCGHSFVSDTGLYCHKKLVHTKEEIEWSESQCIEKTSPLYCEACQVQFRNDTAFATHFGSSSKHADTNISTKQTSSSAKTKRRGRPRAVDTVYGATCEICQKYLCSDSQARKHYESEHPGSEYTKRYMCDICGHITKQYANLMVHMRRHTQEKPYACPHCDRRFSMANNRDRHLVVHTGEKRYECQHCNRRFTQSSAVKLHIQTVHLKIPYAPWDKKNRKRKRQTDSGTVLEQQKIVADPMQDYINAYITYNE
ncbi:zinc finger protein 271-like [Leptidea sinapis]|uniref:zinc finger protein 271-like n=1 Tax=Leptidea sinapis TaxID=189913 RepID=UPI0021C3E6CA|nr:zinc finger protein 271-like [Leptidea sinapis]